LTEQEALEPPRGSVVDGAGVETAAALVPPVVGARQLIASSFELMLRGGDQMRRASFYIGIIVLGLVGPFVLAIWGFLVANPALDLFAPSPTPEASAASGWLVALLFLLLAGILIAGIESTGLAIALLGGEQAGRPLGIRAAVQRTRMSFWALVVASLCVTIPITIVQSFIGQTTQVGFVSGLVLATLIQTRSSTPRLASFSVASARSRR
jgi:hypothetical protein